MIQSKKIRTLVSQFLAHSEVGGAALIGMKLAEECKCKVWTPRNGRARQTALEAGLQSWAFDNRAMFSKSRLRSVWGNLVLAQSLRRSRSRLVHAHCPIGYATFRRAFRWCGVSRVVHVQIEMSEESLTWAFREPPEMIITCATFLASHVRQSLRDDVAKRVRIEAVPNSVDTDLYHPGDRNAARHAVGILTDRPVALMMANLAPHKGQQTAIQAVRQLKDRGCDVELWCAGVEREGTAYAHELQQLVNKLGIEDRVRFLGFRTDGPDLLRAANALLLPSTHEGLPLTILEAQATKVPVMANATAGVPEIITDGETGYLIPADDAEGYATRMEKLVANPHKCRAIEERAFANVHANHTWSTYKNRIFSLYDELLK